MALKEWYAENADRIAGIAKANNVDLGVAKGMLESNAKGTTNYKGGGVANMSDLSKSYYAAAADGQAQFNNRNSGGSSSKSSKKKNTLYDAYNKQINANYNEAARQAYINKMLSQRDMGDYLSSQGYTGGVSESTMAGLGAEYNNTIAEALSSKKQAQLEAMQAAQEQANYDAEQAFARQQYANQLAQYNQEYADSRSDAAFDNAYKLYAAGIYTPDVLKTLGLSGVPTTTATATGGKRTSGGSDDVDTGDGTPTTTPTNSTMYTDFRQSLIGGTGNVQNAAVQGLTKMFANGEIDLQTYKQRLGRIGFGTDGKMVYPL